MRESEGIRMGNKETLRIDEIGFASLKVIQNPHWFCYGIDAVLLADFAKKKRAPELRIWEREPESFL